MDYGRQALRHLCVNGGEATLDAVCKEISLSPDRIGPIMAGLEHNGYITRKYNAGTVTVILTNRGRDWARQFGVPLSEAPQVGQQAAAKAAPSPAPQTPAAPPRPNKVVLPPRGSAALAQKAKAEAEMEAAAAAAAAESAAALQRAEPAAAEAQPQPEPQPQSGPQSEADQPPKPRRGRKPAAKAGENGELLLTGAAQPQFPEGEAPAAPKRRGRPPKAKPAEAAEAEAVKEVEVDDTGFVTHINGKRLF